MNAHILSLCLFLSPRQKPSFLPFFARLPRISLRSNTVGYLARSKVPVPFLSPLSPLVPNEEGGGPSIFTRPTRFHLNPSDGWEREGEDPRNRERGALSNSILPERTVRLDYTGRDIHPCRGRKPQTWHDLGPLPAWGWGNFEIEFPDYLRSLPLGAGFPATKRLGRRRGGLFDGNPLTIPPCVLI